jgi:drug/metabolite transporter (DMT)-like permease
LIVVGPNLTGAGGYYNLVMLASSPVFAASFLFTKRLTRYETAGVIVFWQALTVTLLSLPLALWNWQNPTALQWLGYLVCGILGSGAHYCLTRSYRISDISSSQSLKFLELVWATPKHPHWRPGDCGLDPLDSPARGPAISTDNHPSRLDLRSIQARASEP